MDKNLWKIENYLDFLAARRELLANAANEFIESLYAGEVPATQVVSEDITQRKVETVPGSIFGADEEELLLDCATWVESKGLPSGEIEYEFCDEETGQVLALLDLAWPNGLQPGLTQPVALVIDEDKEIEKILNKHGYKFFTAIDELKKYVKKEILGNSEEVVLETV